MKSARPDTSEPIPLRRPPHNMATITIRFVGLLSAAVVALALIWSRLFFGTISARSSEDSAAMVSEA